MSFVLTSFPLPAGGLTQVVTAPPGAAAGTQAVQIAPAAAVKTARLARAQTAKTLKGLGCCCERERRGAAVGKYRTARALARRGMSGLGVPSWLPDLVGIGGLAAQDFLQAKVHQPTPVVTTQTTFIPPTGTQFAPPPTNPAPPVIPATYTTPTGNTTGGAPPAPPAAAQPNWFTEQTIISGVPNWILPVGGLAALFMFSKSHRR